MKISTVLDHIDSGHMALPEFQRGYVWNRDQVRGLFDSLYRRHPVGGLLVWATESKTAAHRGDGQLAAGIVKLLLDGQRRITSLYGVVRGKAARFFDGNAQAFTGLRFHLEAETFAFYQPVKMQDDPLWIDVTELMKKGMEGLGEFVGRLSPQPEHVAKVGIYVGRLSRLLGITEVDLYVEEVTGTDKTLDVVVNIFNRVNSGGTKLSKGDLALAKICSDWPDARDTMKAKLKEWAKADFHFNLDWLLRSVNTALTGEAKFQFLHDKSAEEIQNGLKRASKHIDTSLNLISGRLGLDHDQVFFGRFAVPVMVRYLDQRSGSLGEKERDKLLFWFVQAGMWGRFSGSTETYIDQDLAALEGEDGGLDKLLDQLRLWHGGLRIEPGHFTGWSLGAPVLPGSLPAHADGRCPRLGHGAPAQGEPPRQDEPPGGAPHLPQGSTLQTQVQAAGSQRPGELLLPHQGHEPQYQCPAPEQYFPEVEEAHPGGAGLAMDSDRPVALEDRELPRLPRSSRRLLAAEANRRMEELLHDETRWLEGPASPPPGPWLKVASRARPRRKPWKN